MKAEEFYPNTNKPSTAAKQSEESSASTKEPSGAAKPADKSSSGTEESSLVAKLFKFVEEARYGDAKVLPKLKQILDNNPFIWQHVGDLGRVVRESWAKRLAGESALGHESLLRKAEALRADLAGANSTPAVTMAVDLVVGSWLELEDAQLALAEPARYLAQRKFQVRRAEVAHKKFLASMKMLETMRTLLPVSKGATTMFKVFEPAAKEAAR